MKKYCGDGILSSIIYEGIREFYTILRKDPTRTKSTKSTQANENKKDSIFMRIKTSKRKKVACWTSCAFYTFGAFCAFCACGIIS